MTLNKNIDNFHNESEQIAFSPAVTIGGDWPPSLAQNVCYSDFFMLDLGFCWALLVLFGCMQKEAIVDTP